MVNVNKTNSPIYSNTLLPVFEATFLPHQCKASLFQRHEDPDPHYNFGSWNLPLPNLYCKSKITPFLSSYLLVMKVIDTWGTWAWSRNRTITCLPRRVHLNLVRFWNKNVSLYKLPRDKRSVWKWWSKPYLKLVAWSWSNNIKYVRMDLSSIVLAMHRCFVLSTSLP